MSKFLDIGCGSGLACAIAADRGARIFGLDASPGLLEIARRRVPKGDFGTADMESLPWRDRRFDVITFFNSIFFADLSAKIFACTMELRKHPKMTWQGSPNWPPQWHRPYGPDKPLPEGEIGFFKAVDKSSVSDLLHTVTHNDQDYFGSLSFDDEEFCNQISGILMGHVGEPISAIGSLDIP